LRNRTTGMWSVSAKPLTARRNAVPIFSMIAGEGIGQPRVRSHERHHLPGDLKGRYVAIEIHPVQALDIKGHVTIEKLTHCQRCSHVNRMTPAEHTKPARTSAVRGEASLGVCPRFGRAQLCSLRPLSP
jgi:hypothetical protein